MLHYLNLHYITYHQFVNTTNTGCPWVQQLLQNIWQLQTFYMKKQLCSETQQKEHHVQHNLCFS